MHGEIAGGQVMPKNFTFCNPDEHKRIIQALERYAPVAVVAATGRDPQMAGSQYPFPPAELLQGYRGTHTIEIVPFNGEDNYANPGELLWIEHNRGRCDDIVLGINIDDAGMRETLNHVSFYNCPSNLEHSIREAMRENSQIAEGPAWYQGDHMVLAAQGCPAIAIASSDMVGFMAAYAHSERDTVDLADPVLIARGACFVREVIRRLAE